MPPTAQSTCQMLRKVSKQHIEVLTLIMSCVCFVQVRVVAKFESCAFGAFLLGRLYIKHDR